MTNRQLSDHIGNMDDRMVELAANVPNFARRRRVRAAKRFAGLAAALAIAVGGGLGLGATVFAQEVEVPVEVPAEQETITLGDSGVTLILPDSWKGKYAVEHVEGEGSCSYKVYNPEFRENAGGVAGYLFYIDFYEGIYATQAEVEGRYSAWQAMTRVDFVACTREGTYVIQYPSDVQINPFGDDEPEYRQMEREISQIRVVLDNALNSQEDT